MVLLVARRHFSVSFRSLKDKVSSNMWLTRQRKDPYVKRAVKETYRARSAFKLIEIDDKYKFLSFGDVVIDVGAAPGSWSQVAVKRTNADESNIDKSVGIVVSIDRDYIQPLKGATVLSHSDILDEKTITKIMNIVNGKPVSSVLSDMAPNATGQKSFDHDAIIELQTKALNLAKKCLKVNGTFLCKLWFGDRVNEFMKELNKNFETVKTIKPDSSRSDSAEMFIIALKYKSTAS